jgi:hypothetical protein
MTMNIVRLAFLGSCILLFDIIGFAGTDRPFLTPAVDQWFDSYGDLSWEDERAHLDNFAVALQHDAHAIGYIIVYAGRVACVRDARDRALRAKKYLVTTHGIEANRIKWIDGGYREKLTVILQPAPGAEAKLIASPTLKRSEVRILRNCKQKKRHPKFK